MAQEPIKGYRELSEQEIALINQVKELGVNVGKVITILEEDTVQFDQRWVAIGKTDLQTGFMALVRSIAQPESF